MGIFATELSVLNYRSFPAFDLALDPGVTVLVGRNAVGKTNLVEALQLLTAGTSFRKPAPAELVREGCERGRVALTLEGDGRVLDMALEVAAGRRSFSRNGKKTTAAGVRGVLPSVLFCPDHLDMVKRSASVRRAALDDFGVQLNDGYAKLVASYERTVEQRNNLLKEWRPDPSLLAAWDESLAAAGSALLLHRQALLARIRTHFRDVHAAIAPHECADVAYVPSIDGLDAILAADDGAAARDAVSKRFIEALAGVRADELRRGMTLVGPHRDEVLFTIDGRPARDYGSQGQQRTLVLAWKIAEVQVTRDILGRSPLLLLDDVMSELDAGRRDAIMGFIEGEIQAVITTTNLGYFSGDVLDAAKVVRIGDEGPQA